MPPRRWKTSACDELHRSVPAGPVVTRARRRRPGRAVSVQRAAAPAAAPPDGGRRGGEATQPFNRVVWPHEPAAVRAPLVYDAWSATRIPGVARALQIYTGSLKQAPMDDYLGIQPMPRPRLLDQPDPDQARSWFVQTQVEDYFLHGNAVAYVTAYTATGWPAAVTWLPSSWVQVACPPRRYNDVTYMVDGIELDRSRVVHVKRGADRRCPARGVSIVEQHLATLDRAAMEEEYERDALANGAVPSVAIITANPRLGQTVVDEAKIEWMAKFGGPHREPAILPAGTQVIPLGFSPEDSQMIEARKMTLVDIANVMNLDGYWLGAPGGSMTYRSPGSMYTNLLRVSLEPVLADFEDVWSAAWLPRGHRVRFDRNQLTRDDLATTMQTLVAGVTSVPAVLTVEEARAYLALPVQPGTVIQPAPTDTVPAPPAEEE